VQISNYLPNEDRDYLFRACYIAKMSVTITCVLPQRQEKHWEHFMMEKGDGFRCALIRSFLLGKVGSELNRVGTSYGIGSASILGSL
jgi:hypothetical protein